jgi:hypothetical protein
MHDDSVLQFYQKCISKSNTSISWMSKLLVEKGHIHCHGLVRRLHVEKITINGIPKCLNYCVIFIVCT